tara:strand:+ start:504 stop:710 length:207 start_codon:yes stop_codon:yes gene_type:complete
MKRQTKIIEVTEITLQMLDSILLHNLLLYADVKRQSDKILLIIKTNKHYNHILRILKVIPSNYKIINT